MMKLFSLFGIPLYADPTFWMLVVLCIINAHSIGVGISVALILSSSIVAHELGHSLTARAFGIGTSRITLSLLGGCASLNEIPTKPIEELLVAFTGPAVSFVIAVVSLMAYNESGTALLQYCGVLNIMLGTFNLLPGFPMDGGRVLRAVLSIFMPRCTATWWAMCVGRCVAILMAIWGISLLFSGHINGLVLIFIAFMVWKQSYKEYLGVIFSGNRW